MSTNRTELSDIPVESDELGSLEKYGYRILQKLSQGSYAHICIADYKQPGLDDLRYPEQRKKLACRIIETASMPQELGSKFLVREIDILSKIRHPYIIQLHSILTRTTRFYIFMRLAEYGNLCDFLITHGPLKEQQAKVWIRQIALAVMYLHVLDIAHRDIKCENILITQNHNLRLADFGFARFTVDNLGRNQLSMTFCGSFAYAAPELIRGIPYNPKSADIWSMGIVLYAMLNKSLPFKTENLRKFWMDQVNKNYRFRSKILPIISEQVVEIVGKLLEPDTTLRMRLDDLLNSHWIKGDPNYTKLSKEEKRALQDARKLREEIRPKIECLDEKNYDDDEEEFIKSRN